MEALRVGDSERLNNLIENVVAHADTAEQKARAEFSRTGWHHVRVQMANCIEIKRLLEHGPAPGTRLESVFSSDFEAAESVGKGAAGARDDWSSAGMPKGWGNRQRASSHATFGWDRATGKDSQGALTLDSRGSDGQPLCFLRTVTTEPNALYRATCDVRTREIDQDAGVSITVKWQDKDGNWTTEFATVVRGINEPTRDRWEHLEAYVRTPGIEQPRLVFMPVVERTKQGRVWFDNVELRHLTEGRSDAH